jgi:hypothetical protein
VWAPDYVTADELADYLRIKDDLDDVELAEACSGASRAVDEHCHRQFGKVDAPEVRYYTARWSKTRQGWLVPVDDFQTAAGLSVTLDLLGDGSYSSTVDLTYYVKLPINAARKGRPWEALLIKYVSPIKPNQASAEVGVLATWGWTDVPTAVKLATKFQASRFDFRRSAPAGVAGSPEQGSELRLLAKLDPDVAVDLRSYRRLWKVGMFG